MRTIYLFCFLFLFAQCKTIHTAKVEPGNYKMDAMGHFAPDERAIGLIAPYKAQLDADMNTIIGQAASEMNKAQPESTLGNWLADLLYEKTVDYHGKKVDLALVNYGGIRIPSIPQGGISRSRIYELMPFDNAMVLVYLDGATLLQLCDHMASKGGWPISQHLRYEITDGKAAQVELNGKAIQSDQIYVVSLSDYLANGGDSCDFLQDKKRENLEILVRDAILEYVEEKGKAGVVMSAELDGRVRQK